MTAPVSVLVELDGQETGEASAGNAVETTFTMAFYIPAPFDENPPLPIDPSVSIEYRPELRILARYILVDFSNVLFNYSIDLMNNPLKSGQDFWRFYQ